MTEVDRPDREGLGDLVTADPRMPNFWWCPTHHLYRGGDKRPCADAVQLVPESAEHQPAQDSRIREIRDVLADWYPEGPPVPRDVLNRIRAILDSAPPAPQPWQVEARIQEQRATSLGYCEHIVEVLSDGEEETCSNLRLRGQVHCEEHVTDLDRLRAAMIEADRNYQPPPEPDPDADRWASARNTCPHGIVRGLITCPVCEPEKQAAAEASFRAVADRGRAEQEEALRGDRHAEITEAEASEARDG